MAAAQGGTEEGSLLSVVSLTMASHQSSHRRKAVTVLKSVQYQFLEMWFLVLLSSFLVFEAWIKRTACRLVVCSKSGLRSSTLATAAPDYYWRFRATATGGFVRVAHI